MVVFACEICADFEHHGVQPTSNPAYHTVLLRRFWSAVQVIRAIEDCSRFLESDPASGSSSPALDRIEIESQRDPPISI